MASLAASMPVPFAPDVEVKEGEDFPYKVRRRYPRFRRDDSTRLDESHLCTGTPRDVLLPSHAFHLAPPRLTHSARSPHHAQQVPMTMHAGHRDRLIARFQTPDTPANAVLLFEGGHAENRHETDHEPVFRQESFFAYLFGVKEPDCYGVRTPSASSAPRTLHADHKPSPLYHTMRCFPHARRDWS